MKPGAEALVLVVLVLPLLRLQFRALRPTVLLVTSPRSSATRRSGKRSIPLRSVHHARMRIRAPLYLWKRNYVGYASSEQRLLAFSFFTNAREKVHAGQCAVLLIFRFITSRSSDELSHFVSVSLVSAPMSMWLRPPLCMYLEFSLATMVTSPQYRP